MAVQVVTACIRDAEGRILVQQRPAGKELGGLWETPGGKVDLADQNERAALRRELEEELGLDDVEVIGRSFLRVTFDPPAVRRSFEIAFFHVRLIGGVAPRALEGQQQVAFRHIESVLKDPCVPSLRVLGAFFHAIRVFTETQAYTKPDYQWP
jgi:mutator protein MutT